MTAQELFQYLTQDAGLDDATTKVIMDQVAKNEKVSSRAAGLKQQSEYDALNARAEALQKAATDAAVYQDWYAKNFGAIEKLQKDFLRYQERYGALDGDGQQQQQPQQQKGAVMDEKAIQEAIDKRINEAYNPRWSDLITSSGTILERHIRSGRKNHIDWKKVGELAQAKGGDLNAAYEEWDRPEADAAAKAAQDAEVKRRVDEELAKRQTTQFFPAGAEGAASGASTGITRSNEGKKYDRNAVVQAALTGKYEAAVQ